MRFLFPVRAFAHMFRFVRRQVADTGHAEAVRTIHNSLYQQARVLNAVTCYPLEAEVVKTVEESVIAMRHAAYRVQMLERELAGANASRRPPRSPSPAQPGVAASI